MNKAAIYGLTKKEIIFKTRHVDYFSDEDNAVLIDGVAWHVAVDYIQKVLGVQKRVHALTILKKALSVDEIKNSTKYITKKRVVLEVFDAYTKGKTAVMTKSGLHTFLQNLPGSAVNCSRHDYDEPNSVHYKLRDMAAKGIALLIDGDSTNNQDAPMQQPYRQEQPEDAVSATASIAQEAPTTVLNDTESDSD